jgi:copper(I)-binding protein
MKTALGRIVRCAFLTWVLAAGTSTVLAQKGVHVEHAWARATPPGATLGAAYFVITAHGGHSDRLIGVSSPVAAKAEFHTNVMEDGMMKMRQIESVEVSGDAPVGFEPGRNHVMLMGLKGPLTEGDQFQMTLTLEKLGAIETQVTVRAIGTTTMEHQMDHSKHQMQ